MTEKEGSAANDSAWALDNVEPSMLHGGVWRITARDCLRGPFTFTDDVYPSGLRIASWGDAPRP